MSISKEEFKELGFQDAEDDLYLQIRNGRSIKVYSHPNGGGYYVVEIQPTPRPAQNNRIVTKEHLEKFIKLTCPNEKDDVINEKIPCRNF